MVGPFSDNACGEGSGLPLTFTVSSPPTSSPRWTVAETEFNHFCQSGVAFTAMVDGVVLTSTGGVPSANGLINAPGYVATSAGPKSISFQRSSPCPGFNASGTLTAQFNPHSCYVVSACPVPTSEGCQDLLTVVEHPACEAPNSAIDVWDACPDLDCLP